MNKKQSPTIEDVARRAGVSRSTASLVINKSPLVREKTRLLVEKVIEEIHYVPNSNARALSARTTGNLGVVFMQDYLPESTQISYNNDQHVGLASFNFSNGIMAGLVGTDYGIIMERFCSVNMPDELPRIINEKRVDGVFIVGLPYSAQFIPNLKKTGLPFVLVGIGNYQDGVDSIYTDPGEGTEMAVRELLETGHRRICLLNWMAVCVPWKLMASLLTRRGISTVAATMAAQLLIRSALSGKPETGRMASLPPTARAPRVLWLIFIKLAFVSRRMCPSSLMRIPRCADMRHLR